jgi:hypothetical protein
MIYDVELEAQITATTAESESATVILSDATSPVDAALSFATAHDRHRSDFHCDEKLAALTAAWVGRTVTLQHTCAHAGVTANEWADLEVKAALAAGSAPPRAFSRPHCAAILISPGVEGEGTSAKHVRIRIRTWAVRRLAAATNAWLKSHSKRTIRAAPDDMVASQIHPMSADGLLLQALAGRRVFGCDGGHFHAPDVARAHREIACACGAPNRAWLRLQ